MGSSCGETQAELLASIIHHEGRIWLMPDGDASGKRLAHSVFEQVAPCRFLRWIELEDGKQPDDCPAKELAERLGW